MALNIDDVIDRMSIAGEIRPGIGDMNDLDIREAGKLERASAGDDQDVIQLVVEAAVEKNSGLLRWVLSTTL